MSAIKSSVAALFGDSEEGRNVAAYFSLLCEQQINQFPAIRHYIGKYHGEVVATGTLFVGSETVGIYDIATRDEYRHRGIGSAMFAYLLREARSCQHHYAVLQASTEGIGIYLKAGFTPIGDVHVFESRTLL
ncbi:MAG: GNAT family N-acetyltransferase [Brasilonema sp.]